MTIFWKPFVPENVGSRQGRTYKHLGRGTYEMWCRCDLCFRSGPSTGFVFLARGDSTGEMCEDCSGDRLTMMELYADGWTKR